ncbi:UNVERIFIED_CONTAM: hypothetical protein Sindi_1863200 [Sesamum indicum]
MKIIEGLRDNMISFERSPLKYGNIPTSPSVPYDQRGKNISDVKLIRNITSPGLKDHEKSVRDWNIELKFGGKEAPDFKGDLVMKEKVRDSLHLLQTANASRGKRDAILFESAVDWYPVMEDFPNKNRNSRPDKGRPEIFEDGKRRLYEEMKGANREPTIIPERYITSSKAPKNVLLRDRFNATNSSPNVRVLRFSFSRGKSRLFTISTNSKAGP